MTKADWIRRKLSAGVTRDQLYMMYKSFVKEAGDGMSYDVYKRKVRKYDNETKKHIIPAKPLTTEQIQKSKETVARSFKDGTMTIDATLIEVNSLDELIERCSIDPNKWVAEEPITIKQWQMGYKDADSNGRILQLSSVKAKFVNKDNVPDSDEKMLKDLIRDAKKYAPKYPTIKYNKMKSGNALEIALYDHHFGQLSWGLETGGKNYDIKISNEMALDAMSDILSHAQYYKPEKIIIPIGNDFFNVNDQTNTTQHGTPQAEDERWQKTFISGRTVWTSILEMCQSVAPTKAMWIPGNHDPERSFHLCDSLYCWFHNSQVEIDHSPNTKKVEVWGDTACLYTHGCNERKNDLPTVFATTFPKEFAEAKYRAMHLGHLHHSDKSSLTVAEDVYSVDVKIKPSLVPLNAWSAGKAYKAIARTEAEVWNKEKGLIADLYYND